MAGEPLTMAAERGFLGVVDGAWPRRRGGSARRRATSTTSLSKSAGSSRRPATRTSFSRGPSSSRPPGTSMFSEPSVAHDLVDGDGARGEPLRVQLDGDRPLLAADDDAPARRRRPPRAPCAASRRRAWSARAGVRVSERRAERDDRDVLRGRSAGPWGSRCPRGAARGSPRSCERTSCWASMSLTFELELDEDRGEPLEGAWR